MTMDYLAQFSADQSPCQAGSEVCNKHVILFASDSERNEFFKRAVVKMLVKTTFTGMASGMNVQLRMASAANLTSDAVVLAQTGILLPANLVAGDHYELVVPARRWVSGYDYFGVYYNLVNEVATAGTVNCWLDDGPESYTVVDTAI